MSLINGFIEQSDHFPREIITRWKYLRFVYTAQPDAIDKLDDSAIRTVFSEESKQSRTHIV
jgi:hypothetical protein